MAASFSRQRVGLPSLVRWTPLPPALNLVFRSVEAHSRLPALGPGFRQGEAFNEDDPFSCRDCFDGVFI